MDTKVLKLLTDILEAAIRIRRFTEGITYEEYRDNELLRSAVERQFMVIGEALVRLRRDAPEIYEQCHDAPSIVGFRNVLVHGYDVVDDQVLWSAVTVHLPALVETVRILMGEEPL